MNIGQEILDKITDSNLCAAICGHDDSHGTVIVWSSGAAEQLEAIINSVINRRVGSYKCEECGAWHLDGCSTDKRNKKDEK